MAREFPLKRTFMRDPKLIFKDLLEHKNKIEDPKKNTPFHKSLCDLMFYKQDTGNILVDDDDYEVDILSDYYQEHIRIQCKKFGRTSILEFWQSNPNYFTKDLDNLDNKTVREAIYNKAGRYECTQFKCTVSKTIYEMFEAKSVLDFSSGYGDRILGAIASNTVEKYLGYDPNTELRDGHTEMINTFCPIVNKNTLDFEVIYEPFEDAELKEDFDLVFTSPPFFKLEEYTNEYTQSHVKYYTYNRWMKSFLFKALDKSWNNLKVGGHLIMYIGNYENVNIVEPMNIYLELLEDSEFWGCLSFSSTNTKKRRYFWVWKKVDKASPEKRKRIKDAKRLSDNYMFLF